MPSLSLEDQLFVLQGDPVNESDFTKGRSVDVWIAPLSFAQDYPDQLTIVNNIAILANDTTATLNCTEKATTLYRNDVLNFGATKIIVKATTTIVSGGVGTAVPIFAAPGGVTITSDAKIYEMLPLVSAKEGAFVSASATYAEAHNKAMGLYAVSQKVREDYTATISGDIAYNDPALAILQDMSSGGLSKVFVQARYTVAYGIGGSDYGDGALSEQYRGNSTISLTDGEGAMVGFSMEVKISGRREKYALLT